MAKRSAADRELSALSAIMGALEGLDGDSIQRVLEYVFSRLSIAPPIGRALTRTVPATAHEALVETARSRKTSIRDLRDEKQPESANQMAALVAYYLSEVAEPPERKNVVTTADISRYFKEAGFRLPKATQSALPNAAAAGYFVGLGGGQYKLNAVGYNLVVHGLPRQAKNEDTRRARPKNRVKARSQTRATRTPGRKRQS